MNPIINQMMSAVMSRNPIMQMFRQVMTARNPNMMMQSLAQNNSQLQQTLDFINQNGGNAKKLFYQMAQQKNEDPNVIINQLKQEGGSKA